MSEPDGLDERVTRLEGEVALARQDAAAARVLAGGADRDVAAMQSELRGHTRLLNALRENQVEQGDRIDRLDRKVDEGFAKIDERFAMIDQRFAKVDEEMREGFSVLAVGQAQITALLTAQLDEPGETDWAAACRPARRPEKTQSASDRPLT